MYSEMFLRGLEISSKLASAVGYFNLNFEAKRRLCYKKANFLFILGTLGFTFTILYMFVRTAIYKYMYPLDVGTFAISYVFSLSALVVDGVLVFFFVKGEAVAEILTEILRYSSSFESNQNIDV